MTKRFGAGVAFGMIGAALVAVAIWLTVAYTGAYNVAASDQHADVVRWTFATTMRHSIASRAGDVALPESFSNDQIAEGARHYSESCVYCHGAPGEDPTQWSRGMRPEPPELIEAAAEWSPEEIHWIVSNGIKMSGMPAFGSEDAPEEIVALTAFVSALPGLNADDYKALASSEEPARDASRPQSE